MLLASLYFLSCLARWLELLGGLAVEVAHGGLSDVRSRSRTETCMERQVPVPAFCFPDLAPSSF